MTPVSTYSFLPWLRQGIANTIATAHGDPAVTTRARAYVELALSGDPVGGGAPLTQTLAQDIALYGPGDIVGIDTRAVVRTEPRHLVTNFESNFLPAVDFYDEDFPWRYTPAAPDASRLRLRPWITLVVLAEHEFEEGRSLSGRPLPFITIADAAAFPAADELWAWAHVHFNEPLSSGPDELVSPDMAAVLARVAAIVARNRDAAYSRLVCPRRLDDNTDYHAFVVPTFETGRLAGLGLDPAGAPHATASAWESYAGRAEATNYPVYYRWFFRTGSRGDFEFLVRLLKPRPVDKRVGTRDMDVQDPAPNIPGILDPELGGILRLGGALRVPDADLDEDDLAERRKYENWDQPYPHRFQGALAAFVDLADDYAERSALDANTASAMADDDPDPLITSPLYGRWHALTQRLLTKRDGTPAPNDANWVHRLNLDPRFRVPAAFATGVVQANDEQYMDDAWQQIGDVLDANARIRRLHLATDVSLRWYDRHLTPLAAANPERAFAIAAPVAGHALVGGSTLAHLQTASLVPPTLTSTAMRRALRPRARLMRGLPLDATAAAGNLLARVNAGQVSAAPPKVVPPGAPTVDQAAAEPRFPVPPVAAIAIAIVVLIGLAIVVALAIGLLHPGGAGRARAPAAALAAGARSRAQLQRGRPDAGGGRPAAAQPRLRAQRVWLERQAEGGRDRQPNRGPLQGRAARLVRAARRQRRRRGAAPADDARPACPHQLGRCRGRPGRDGPAARVLDDRHTAIPQGAGRRPVRRGDGLSADRPADVRAAEGDLGRAVPAQHQPHRAEQHHADRDQPEVHRGLHGRPQPRVRPRAALARVPDRPARQLLPPVLGRPQLHQQRRAQRERHARAALRHPRAAPWLPESAPGPAQPPCPTRPAGRAGGARDPRRAAQEVPDRRHLRAPRGLGAESRRVDRPERAARARAAPPGPRRSGRRATRSAARSTRPRRTPTSTSSAST